MSRTLVRIAQRYFIPRFLVAIYYSLRFRCMVSPRANVQLTRKIRFGRGTLVKPYAIIQTTGGRIVLGERCLISSFVLIATHTADVILGDDLRCGSHVVIDGSKRKFSRRDVRVCNQGYSHRGAKIGSDVHLGAGSIMFEPTIGDGAIIGAGAVVTKEVAPYTIVAGVPARVIGERT